LLKDGGEERGGIPRINSGRAVPVCNVRSSSWNEYMHFKYR
jgi:hypothetical protein